MFGKPSSRWIRRAVQVAVPALVLILFTGQVLAASGCKKVKGRFTLQAVPGPDCTSPAGICTQGNLTGDLAGTSVFTASSLIPTVDTPVTSVVFVTGDTTLTTDGGLLFLKEAISLNTTGNGEFAEVNSIVGGTGQWASGTGRFTATGEFLNGSGSGTYIGEACVP